MFQSNTYDASGRLLQRVDGVGSGVKYEYDFTGAQRRMESMGGASQELEYDAQGRITGVVDGKRHGYAGTQNGSGELWS